MNNWLAEKKIPAGLDSRRQLLLKTGVCFPCRVELTSAIKEEEAMGVEAKG
jgi:hypothetical protein